MRITELPALVIEFKDLAVDYLVQETVLPLKRLGRVAGFSMGAALAWAAGILLLAVASMRAIVDLLPDSPYWEALGYLLTALALLGVAAIFNRFGPRPDAEHKEAA